MLLVLGSVDRCIKKRVYAVLGVNISFGLNSAKRTVTMIRDIYVVDGALKHPLILFKEELRRRDRPKTRIRGDVSRFAKRNDMVHTVKSLKLPHVQCHFKGEKSASISTRVSYDGITYQMRSNSVQEATVASKLACMIAKQTAEDEERALYTQLYEEYLHQGPCKPEYVARNEEDLEESAFLQVSLTEQAAALEEIRNDVPYVPRSQARVGTRDLRRCARCSWVFSTLDQRICYCTCCSTQINQERKYGWRSRTMLLVKGARNNSERRQGKRQRDGTLRVMGESEMNHNDVANKLEAQWFRCALTKGLPHGGLWLHPCNMSPEREDETKTYLSGGQNWSLVHIAFQSFQKQWTLDKVSNVPALRHAPSIEVKFKDAFDWCTYYEALAGCSGDSCHKVVWSQRLSPQEHTCAKAVQVRTSPEGNWITYRTGTEAKKAHNLSSTIAMYLRGERRLPNGLELRMKPVCVEPPVRHPSLTDAARDTGAAVSAVSLCCNGRYKYANGHRFWFESGEKRPNGDLPLLFRVARGMLYDAKWSTEERNKVAATGHRTPLPPPSITIRQILELFYSQKMRCAYLGIPLFLHEGDWQATLERKNRDLAYTPDNCCIVVGEVNTGSFQWSASFANRVWNIS